MSTKKKILIVISLILMFGTKYLPSIMGLNPIGMATLGITVGTLILLVGVNLIWPAFLCMIAFAVNGVYSLNAVISGALGGSIFWFLLINAMVIGAIEQTGLLRRVALWLTCRPIAKKSPWMFLSVFILAELICGSLMNTTAVCLLFLALTKEIMDAIGVEKGQKFGATLMFVVASTSNVSHAITSFGHSNTILSINYFQDLGTLNFLQYSIAGYIIMFVGLALTIVAMKVYSRMDVTCISGFDPGILRAGQGPMTRQEKIAGVILGGIIFFWILPTFLQNSAPEAYKFLNSTLGIVAPLICGLVLLCLIRVEGKPLMDLGTSLKSAPWGAAMAVGISLFLGTAMQNADAGMIDAFAGAFTPLCSRLPGFAFVVIISLIVLVMTQFTSCALSTTVGSLISVALIQSGAVTGVNTMGLAICLAITCQAAMATPPAGAPAGILAGQGWVTPAQQFKDGFVYNILWWVCALAAYFLVGVLF